MEIKYNNNQGFSLVELIVAVAIFAILAVGVISVVTNDYSNFFGARDKQLMTRYAQEGIEAARSIRDNNWTDLENVIGSNNGLTKNANGRWEFNGTSDTWGGFTRVVAVAAATRGDDGVIVTSGGDDYQDTIKVAVTVSATGVDDYVLITYLTNWQIRFWEQTDWSADYHREYWISETAMASSVIEMITSTAGQLTRQAGAPASVMSSLYDTGAEEKELHSITIEQGGVSSSCTLQLIIDADTNYPFSATTSQIFRDNSATNFTSTTNANMSNKRFLRYYVEMAGCDTASTTLYSIKLKYR